MITDYATLQTEIAGELHRTDLEAKIPTWIAFAEKRFNRKLRVRQQETIFASVDLVDGETALPADFAEFKALWVAGDSSKQLTVATSEYIRTRATDASSPRCYALEGDNIICWPSAGAIQGIYYAKVETLSDVVTTNWLLEDAPDLYYYEALSYSAAYLKNDPRIATWRAESERILSEVISSSRAASISGGPLTVRVR